MVSSKAQAGQDINRRLVTGRKRDLALIAARADLKAREADGVSSSLPKLVMRIR
jgi:hypothetical protein